MSSPNKQSGGLYDQDKNKYGVAKSSEDGNSTEERANGQSSVVIKAQVQLGRDSTQSVNSISMEYDPLMSSTPLPSHERNDGRYLRMHEMIQHQDDSFYPVSDTDSEASHLDTQDNAPDSKGHQDSKVDGQSCSPDRSLKLRSSALQSHPRPTLMLQSQSSPLQGRSLVSGQPKEQPAPFKMGLVSQEDLDALDREEEEMELRGEMIGKQSVQLGAALGLKSSIKAYESPSNLLKKKLNLKPQGVSKIENGSLCRKISPLVLGNQNADGGTTSAFMKVSTGTGTMKLEDAEECRQGGVHEKQAASDLSLSLSSSDDLRRRIHQHESVPQDGSSSSSPRRLQSIIYKSFDAEDNENENGNGNGKDSTQSDVSESDDQFAFASPSELLYRYRDPSTSQHSSIDQDLISDELSYTSPSQLLCMDTSDSKEALGRSLSDNNSLYNTPSELSRLQTDPVKHADNKEPSMSSKCMPRNRSADILQKLTDREQMLKLAEFGREVYGKMSYTTPSTMLQDKGKSFQDNKLKNDPSCQDKYYQELASTKLIEEYLKKSTEESSTDIDKFRISQNDPSCQDKYYQELASTKLIEEYLKKSTEESSTDIDKFRISQNDPSCQDKYYQELASTKLIEEYLKKSTEESSTDIDKFRISQNDPSCQDKYYQELASTKLIEEYLKKSTEESSTDIDKFRISQNDPSCQDKYYQELASTKLIEEYLKKSTEESSTDIDKFRISQNDTSCQDKYYQELATTKLIEEYLKKSTEESSTDIDKFRISQNDPSCQDKYYQELATTKLIEEYLKKSTEESSTDIDKFRIPQNDPSCQDKYYQELATTKLIEEYLKKSTEESSTDIDKFRISQNDTSCQDKYYQELATTKLIEEYLKKSTEESSTDIDKFRISQNDPSCQDKYYQELATTKLIEEYLKKSTEESSTDIDKFRISQNDPSCQDKYYQELASTKLIEEYLKKSTEESSTDIDKFRISQNDPSCQDKYYQELATTKLIEEYLKKSTEESSTDIDKFRISKNSPGFAFFKQSSCSVLEGKNETSVDTGVDSSQSVHVSGYGSHESASSREPARPKNIDWSTQSDITTYFSRLSGIFNSAAALSGTISEPWFMRLFLGTTAASMYEMSECEQTSYEQLTSGQSSTGVSRQDFMEQLSRLIDYDELYEATFSPRGSATTGYQTNQMSMYGQNPENLPFPDITQLAFNKLFWSLFEIDPRSAILTLGSEHDINPLNLRRLFESSTLVPGIDDTGSSQLGDKGSSSSVENLKRSETDLQKKKTTSMSGLSASEIRTMQLEKESLEGQVRKLDIENSGLHGENRILKQRSDTHTARISDLEERLNISQDALGVIERSMNIEISEVCHRNKVELEEYVQVLDSKIADLQKENELLRCENVSFEKQISNMKKEAHHLRTSDKNKTLEAYMRESELLTQEVEKLRKLLRESDEQVADLSKRLSDGSDQLLQVYKVRDMLQQQLDTGGSLAQHQVLALEKRLEITEGRLKLEREDRGNSLSVTEEKLLSENARLQAMEKEYTRQLQREKDKTRNLEIKIRDVKSRNEKLLLSLPIDDSVIESSKLDFDIPYSIHSSKRLETKKVYDINQILTLLEKEKGLSLGQENEIIEYLWNQRESLVNQKRQWEITLQDLNLLDNDMIAGLKSLKEMKDDFENRIKTMEERYEDMKSEKDSLDQLYKEQLGSLTKERHTAFGKLKTLNDMMEAIRAENESLRESLKSSNTTNTQSTVDEGEVKRLNIEIRQLEDKLTELNRTNKQQSIESQSLQAQLDSRNKALEDAQSELSLLTSRLSLDDTNVRKQQKIDRLTTQVSNQQAEMKKLSEKCGILGAENSRLGQQVNNITRELHNTQQQQDIKGSELLQTRIKYLESELEEKDIQAEKAKLHYKQTESKLQEIKQELYFYQEHSSDLKSQVESYNHQINQKITLLDTIGKSEKDKLNQIEVLKDTLNSMTNRLNNKQSQLQICELEMSQVKDLNDKLEEQLQQYTSKHPPPTRSQSAIELQTSQLQAQIQKLKSDIVQAASALKTFQDEKDEISKELSTTRQELNDEKSKIVHLESEKNHLEQQMKNLGEERDVLYEEKAVNEDDLVKLESKLQQVLHRFEDKTTHENSQHKYNQDGTDTDELLSEINSLKLLLDGKDRELEMFNDKQKRNQIEMSYLHHRVENLNKDNTNSREEIDRLTNDVIFKMKETSSTYEVNDYLTKEKAHQQKENIHLQKDLQTEKDYVEKMKAEINSVLLKVDQSEMGQQAIQSELIVKDGEIASYKTEIKHLEVSNKQLETELKHLKSRIEELNTEIHNLTNLKSALENQLTQEKHSVEKEKSLNDKKKEEILEAKQRVDAIKHEQTFLLNALQEERIDKQQLTQQLAEKESNNKDLSQEITGLKKELNHIESNLSDSHSKIDQLQKDHNKVGQEQNELNLIIREKDREISELREKEMIVDETIRKEVTVQKSHFEQEKSVIERELQFAKDEVNTLNNKVQQKELQLQAFGRTLQELDEINRKKYELENQVEKSQQSVSDSKILVESQRKELISLRQENSKLHETFAKSQINCHTLQDELRLIKESTVQQLTEYKTSSAAQKDQSDAEKFSLREAFARSEAKLQATENSLRTLTDSKIQLNNDYRALEATFNDIKTQLTTELTERKLAQQRADNLKANLDEIKNTKSDTDRKLLEVQALLTKTEGDVNQQKEKVKKFNHHNQELEAMIQVNDCTVRAKHEQLELLQGENNKLKQMMETQKQQINTKLRKHTLEQKLIVDKIKQEKQNLSQQAMQLSVDLEQAREQIALKNKENLRLQEDILGLEDEKRSMNSELRASRDNLKTEEVMQSKLVTKFSEQEGELKRLRNMWSKQDDDSDGDPKLMWKKMNSVIQGLSEQIQASNDTQLLKDKETKEKENKVIHRYKKQILGLQSQLNTEKALHEITKNSLKALEEDCARLRQLMHTVRRKSGSPDKKQKSRIEEINEIIVRSQTQAQSMMASGSGAGYLDSSFKNISPSRDYNINANRSQSPDTTSQLSDCSFGSAAGINTSYVHTSGTFQPGVLFTQRK